MIAFNSARLAANFFTMSARFCSRLISASFAMATSVSERKFKCGEKRFGFIVSLRGCRDADVHPAQCIDLVVLDFLEDDLFLDTDVVITATIESTAGYTAKVAHARQRNGNQAVEKLIHLRAAQSHHASDRIPFADLESGDCLACFGHDRFLPGDLTQIAYRMLDHLLIRHRFREPHIQGNLCQARHFHDRLVIEFFGQVGSDFFFIKFLKTGHDLYTFTASPLDLYTRTFFPSTSLIPTRSALPAVALNSATFDT